MNSNALNPEVTELDVQNTVFSDKFSSLIGRQATEEEINALSEEEKQDIEKNYQYTQDYQKQESVDRTYAEEVHSDPNSIFYTQGELNTDISTTIDEGFGRSKEASYRRAKQIMHDYAKLSSAEQAIIDQKNRAQAIERDKTMLTPQEARSLGGEYGIELKYDKNVARGEVMFAIGQNIYKQELEQQLAKYTADQDFSVLQKAGMIGSAISGGVGFYETAATVALGFFLPELAVATIARVGIAGKKGLDIAKGVQLAYKTQRATKLATRSANTAKALNGLTKVDESVDAAKTIDLFAKSSRTLNRSEKVSAQVTKALEDASNTTKLAYQLSNVALRAPGAEQALTLGQRSALLAADGLASSVPAMALSGYNSVRNQTETYTAKDCAIDSLFSASIGGAIPIIGKGFGVLKQVGFDAFGNIRKHVTNTMDNAQAKDVLEGTPSDAVIKKGNKAVKGLNQAASSFKQPDSNFTRAAFTFNNFVMTADEFMDNFRYVAQKLCNGEIPNLANLPHRSLLLSHAGEAFVNSLKRGVSEWTPEVLEQIKTSKIGNLVNVVVSKETGLLGRKTISGYSEERIKDILSDIYRATLDNDMDSYIKVASYVESQKGLANDLLDLAQRAQELKNYNATRRGTAEAIDVDDQEYFKQTLAEILGRIKYGDEYDALLQARKANKEANTLEGIPLETFAKLEEMLKEAGLFGTEKTLRDKRVVFNVDIEKLIALASELDSAADDIADLLDTDDLLKNKYGSADDLIDAINSGTVYSDTDLNQLFGTPRTTTDDFKVRMQEVETQQELTGIEKQKWEAHQQSKEYAHIEQVFNHRDETIRKRNAGDPVNDSFYTKSKNMVATIDQFLSEGINDMRLNIEQFIDSSEFKTFIDASIRRGAESTRKAILKGNTSLVRSMVDKYINEPLRTIGVELSDNDFIELADRFIDSVETGKIKNLEVDPNSKILDKALDEDAMMKQAQQHMQKTSVSGELVDPLILEVQKLVLNKQFQHLHSLNIITEYSKKLMKNPFIPGEVITSIFTYSPYNLVDAGRNVEYLVRNSQAYVRDIEAELRRKSSGTTPTEKLLQGGVDLVEYMHNPENRKGILTAMTYMDWYGSADAAKKAGVPFNADDAVVAQVIRDRYATMLNNLANVGSMRQKIGNRLNLTKLRQADRFIPDSEVNDVRKCFDNILELRVSEEGSVGKGLNKVATIYGKLVDGDVNRAKIALFALKHFDLDKMFNARGTSKYNFNDVREALFTGELLHLAKTDVQQFNTLVDSLGRITDALTGRPYQITKSGSNEFSKGWINSYMYKTEKFVDIKNNLSNRYVADFNDIISFKDVESELKALDLIGYDKVADQLNHDFETGQRAYAILKRAGSEPIRLAEDLMDFHDAYRELRQHDLFKKGTTQYEASKLSKTARNSIMANAAMAAGVDKVESRISTRIIKAFADIFSAPLLVNAGVKSMTDYVYQQEWMLMNGLIESKDLAGWVKGVDSAKNLLQDKELRRLVFYNQAMIQDAILRMRTNVDTDSIGSMVGKFNNLKDVWGAITEGKGTGIERLERGARAFSSFMINDLGCVDKFTQLHRSAAALTLMRSISSKADTSMYLLDKSLMKLLQRQGIEPADWEFLRTHCNVELNDYLIQNGVERANLEKDFKLFIPDNLLNISDDVFRKEMEVRKLNPDNKVSFDNFRNDLYEKASLLINSSADEMTTLPTYRTANAMSLGLNPRSGIGEALGAVMKFQSFGMACTQMHFGRRIAKYCNTSDSANVQTIWRALFGAAGADATKVMYGGLAHLMITTSMAQFIMDEAMDAMKGQTQALTDEKGKVNVSKIVDPIISSTGAFQPILDGTIGRLAQGNMTTSGINLQAVPALSSAWRGAVKVLKPWADDEASISEKAGRSAAAFANNMANQFAVSNYVLTSLVWRHAVGGWLEEQERGAKNYRKYIKNKKHSGYSTNEWYSRFQTNPEPLFGLID